jgi:hypothetical protein
MPVSYFYSWGTRNLKYWAKALSLEYLEQLAEANCNIALKLLTWFGAGGNGYYCNLFYYKTTM